MNILVINALSALRGGGQTYLINFLNYLPKNNLKVLLIVNSNNKDMFMKYSSNEVKVHEAVWASKSIIHRTIWEYFKLPSFLLEENANVYYAPGGIMVTNVPEGIISATALRNMLP